MNRKQKLILAALAIANAMFILTAVLFIVRRPTDRGGTASPTATPQPTPTTQTRPATDDCTWFATRILAEHNLAGVVQQPTEDTLRFELQVEPSADQTSETNAQKIWAAFDVALLIEAQDVCPAIDRVEVRILVQDPERPLHIEAHTHMADLVALNSQEITEDEFIDRVTYTVVESANK